MLIFFKEFYKKFIEPQANDSDCISACGTKYWFKTAVNGIDLDGIGIDAGGTLAKLTFEPYKSVLKEMIAEYPNKKSEEEINEYISEALNEEFNAK